MSWLPFKRPSAPPVTPVVVRAEPEEPEPPRSTLLEKIGKWRAHFAAERQAKAKAVEIEDAREAQIARRQELEEERFARSIAQRGYAWPGEDGDGDEPGSGEPSRMPNAFGGFWFRW